MNQKKMVSEFDVVIIGAGWSGLVACKYMLQEGLTAIVLEATDNIGGVWCYREEEKKSRRCDENHAYDFFSIDYRNVRFFNANGLSTLSASLTNL